MHKFIASLLQRHSGLSVAGAVSLGRREISKSSLAFHKLRLSPGQNTRPFTRGRPPGTLNLGLGLFSSVSLSLGLWSTKQDGSSQDTTDYSSELAQFARDVRLLKDYPNKERKRLLEDLSRADEVYKNGDVSDHDEIMRLLSENADKKEPEVEWRLARITYERSKAEGLAKTEKVKLIEEAFQIAKNALEIDNKNWAVHKWYAILLNEVSILKGLKEQISQTMTVKNHISKAAELNPKDATVQYMLANWCFSVASVTWMERKFAETVFAKPPESSFEEALEFALHAEKLDPGFYSQNTLILAKIYMKLGKVNQAAKYLKELEIWKVRNTDDFLAKTEAVNLIKYHFKTKKDLDDAAAEKRN